MYLDGQLPLGPDSDNNNPPIVSADAVSSLVQMTYLAPGYGDGSGSGNGGPGGPGRVDGWVDGNGGTGGRSGAIPGLTPGGNIAPASSYGGPDGVAIVSPSLATFNGIVQAPVTEPEWHVAGPRTSSYDCGDYGAAGSLTTLRNRAGRGMGYGLSGCNAGYQMNVANVVQDGLSGGALLALGAGLALLVAASDDGGKR